jgi:hypothetical protein
MKCSQIAAPRSNRGRWPKVKVLGEDRRGAVASLPFFIGYRAGRESGRSGPRAKGVARRQPGNEDHCSTSPFPQ